MEICRRKFATYLVDSSYSEAFFGAIKVENYGGHPPGLHVLSMLNAIAEFLNEKKPRSERKIFIEPRTGNFQTTTTANYDCRQSFVRTSYQTDIKLISNDDYARIQKIKDNLVRKTRIDLESGNARGFKAFLPAYKGEMRPAVCAILLNAVTAFSLCMLSIGIGVANPSAVFNLPSTSSVLCNPALNAAGSLVAGYLLDKLVVHTFAEKYAFYKINSVLEESHRDLNFSSDFRAI